MSTPASGAIFYLDFDKNIEDKSGNNGTVIANNGAVYGADKDGNPESSIVISKENNHFLKILKSLGDKSGTISFFICIDDDSNNGVIAVGNNNSSDRFSIEKAIDYFSGLSTIFRLAGSAVYFIDGTGAIKKNVFYSVIITRDLSSGKSFFYLNNLQRLSCDVEQVAADDFFIFGSETGGQITSFRVDDFKIFDKVLSNEERQDIVNKGPNFSASTPVGGITGNLERGLLAMWSFNKNLNDSSQNAKNLNGTAIYDKDFSNNPSSSLGGGSMVGLDEKLICSSLDEPFSYTIWIEKNTFPENQYIIGNFSSSLIQKNGFIYLKCGASEYIVEDVSDLSDKNIFSVRYDGLKLSCFLNGEEKLNKNLSIPISNNNFSVGCLDKSLYPYKSRIDEVRVYNYYIPDSYNSEITSMGVNFELIDSNPPSFNSLSIGEISKRSFSLNMDMDEKSTVYYKISPPGSSVTVDSIAVDYDEKFIVYSGEEFKKTVSGLTPGTGYEVSVFAEDFHGNPQKSLTKISVTTAPLDKVMTPYSNVVSGIYAESKLVKLFSKTLGSVIRYTVYEKSKEPAVLILENTYSSPFLIGTAEDNTFVVKAIASCEDMRDSDILTIEITTKRNSTLKIENSIFPLVVSEKTTSKDFLATLGYKYSLFDIASNNPDSYISFSDMGSDVEIFKIKLSDMKYCGITEIVRNYIYTNITNSGIEFDQNFLFNSSENLDFFDNEINMLYKLVIVNDGEDVEIKGNNKITFIFENISIISKTNSAFSETKKIVYEVFDGLEGSKFEIINKKTNEISYVESSSNSLEFAFVPGVYYKVSSEFTKKVRNTTMHIKGDDCDIYNSFPDTDNILGASIEKNSYGSFSIKINNQNYKFSDSVTAKLFYAGKEIFSGVFPYPQDEIPISYNKQMVDKCGVMTLKMYASKDSIRTTNDTFLFIKVPLNNISGIPTIIINDDFSAEIKNLDLDYYEVKFKIKDKKENLQITEGFITVI